MTLLILPLTSLIGWNHKWVVSSLMIFSIGRTTVSGLNFDPYFFQLCSRTQALKKHQELSGGKLHTYITKSVIKCSAMGRGLKMEIFRLSKIAQKVF
jgi:hypothetical protein